VKFQEYLVSKKIDAKAFEGAEPELFKNWKQDFEQMHPNSFTVQKLNLINPIRRKYQLPLQDKPEQIQTQPETPVPAPVQPAAKPGRPVMKPKPKIN
jgi:hypothetical protein